MTTTAPRASGRADIAPAAADTRASVAVLAPTGRDATMAANVLRREGFAPLVCADMRALCAAIDAGIGVVLLAEEALPAGARGELTAALGRQPTWSDVPLVVLTGEDELSYAVPAGLQEIAARANVTLLERPVRVATLVTALRSALHARRRQFDLRDHLERREATERELEAARADAEAANRAKSDFLTTMSHELRTPLNAISGYTQLLALGVRGPVTDAQRADLERIDRSQRHLLSLINDILNFAKIEAGHIALELEAVSIAALLRDVEPLVHPQLAAHDIAFEDAAAHCDLVVMADEEKTKQVLLNLLSNAIKFTPPGGRISVECEAADQWVRVAVRDTGIGIPGDKLGAIFEPFVQVNRKFTTAHEGTGLGLAISRDLARRMGGDLTVESTPGRGAAFTLVLPRAP